MNKRKLIEKYEYMNRNLENWVTTSKILEDLKQLDEPQKVTVPQFVADWYERNKDNFDYNIWNYVFEWENLEESEFKNWFNNSNKAFQTLVNMHQFGYTVAKDKRYLVKVKGVYFNSALIFDKINKVWFFSSIYEIDHQIGHHTRKQLEDAGFGWVFDCPGVEVEEVE